MSKVTQFLGVLKTGTGAKGQWVLSKVQVDGTTEATTFDVVTVGDEGTLETTEKGVNFRKAKTGGVKAKSFQADPVKLKQEFTLEVARNQSIQRQVALKAAIDLMVAGKRDYGDLIVTFDDMMELLHKQWQPTKDAVTYAGDFAKINPDDFVPQEIDENGVWPEGLENA